jgi:hypothetical protein
MCKTKPDQKPTSRDCVKFIVEFTWTAILRGVLGSISEDLGSGGISLLAIVPILCINVSSLRFCEWILCHMSLSGVPRPFQVPEDIDHDLSVMIIHPLFLR